MNRSYCGMNVYSFQYCLQCFTTVFEAAAAYTSS